MNQDEALTALSALANQTRLDLVRALVAEAPAGLAAGEIGRRFGLAASRLSFHLAALEQAGLVRSRRESRNVFYTAETEQLGRLMRYLLDDCCGAHPAISACCRPAG